MGVPQNVGSEKGQMAEVKIQHPELWKGNRSLGPLGHDGDKLWEGGERIV